MNSPVFSSKRSFSLMPKPMPMLMPPCTWASARAGLISLPQSCTFTMFFNGGMIPKVRESFKSIERGLKSIHIVGWKDADHFVKQINGELNYGTILG